MIERLLIPAWNAPSRSIDDWKKQFEQLGYPPSIHAEDHEETWLLIDSIETRLLAVVEGSILTALHAELRAHDPSIALGLLDQAATGLNWEVHDTEDDEDDER
ncbi:hypothetical protein [Tautonia rosea]|uniref:hypothetical protein n=1 Tax=Tautonia rosea TaxID=2728037 RepID=UPI0014755778|nr:hypothetical protein [Tautonia rosea]